jgi:hypothetical protein
MKGHLYRITVEHLEDNQASQVNKEPLVFEIRNHDDLFVIVERMKLKAQFNEPEAASLAVGLKLFGAVMLNNRDTELFKSIEPHFAKFMQSLKKMISE